MSLSNFIKNHKVISSVVILIGILAVWEALASWLGWTREWEKEWNRDRSAIKIWPGYYYYEFKGSQPYGYIMITGPESPKSPASYVLVDWDVEEFALVDNIIHVARRPTYLEEFAKGAGYTRLKDYCEFYLIKTSDGTVEQVESDEYVRCASFEASTAAPIAR